MNKKKLITLILIIAFLSIATVSYLDLNTSSIPMKEKAVAKVESTMDKNEITYKLNFPDGESYELVVLKKDSGGADNNQPQFDFPKITNQGNKFILSFELGFKESTEVEISKIDNFSRLDHLNSEIQEMKINLSDLEQMTEGKPKSKAFDHYQLYSWFTPTFGSTVFYYMQRSNSKSALRIAPFPGGLLTSFGFALATPK